MRWVVYTDVFLARKSSKEEERLKNLDLGQRRRTIWVIMHGKE